MLRANWSSDMSTGVMAMDDMHHHLFDALTCLSSASDGEFCLNYGALVKIVEQAFSAEDGWMDATDYPSLKIHREQHARVLGALHNVHARVMEGDLAIGRDVVDRLLPEWLAFHMSTMDMALAAWLQDSGNASLKPTLMPSVSYAE